MNSFGHIIFDDSSFTKKESDEVTTHLNNFSKDVQRRNLSYRNSTRRENSKIGDGLCKNILNYWNDPRTCNDDYIEVCEFAISELDKSLTNDGIDINTISDISKATKKENGDLLINGDIIVEVKFSKSNGTHYNTSTDYFKKLGAVSYSDYLFQEGYFSKLDEILSKKFKGKYKINYQNNSPLNEKDARDIMKNYETFYRDEIVPLENPYRKSYAKLIYDYIKSKGYEKKFLEDMITKQESNKSLPDYYLIVNKDDIKNIRVLDKTEIADFMISTSKMTLNGSTIKFEHAHITIAWQNGTGLHNPTIRVFLDD